MVRKPEICGFTLIHGVDNPRIRDSAKCLSLIMATAIRPGSDTDTKAKIKAYGATTLEGKHVKIERDGAVRLQFVGKKGVSLDIPVENPKVAAMLKECAQKAGTDGKLFPATNARILRTYTHEVGAEDIKPKDFRTLLATRTAYEAVESIPPPATKAEFDKAVKKVGVAVSKKLGNTPTVALQSYISPDVFAKWEAGLGV